MIFDIACKGVNQYLKNKKLYLDLDYSICSKNKGENKFRWETYKDPKNDEFFKDLMRTLIPLKILNKHLRHPLAQI